MPGRRPRKGRTLAARQNGGEVTGFRARGSVADPIYAPVLAQQVPAPDLAVHGSLAHAGAKQLLARDHAVLAPGDVNDFIR